LGHGQDSEVQQVLADHAPARANEACLGGQRIQLTGAAIEMLLISLASNAMKAGWLGFDDSSLD
jgi:hypothetical protein